MRPLAAAAAMAAAAALIHVSGAAPAAGDPAAGERLYARCAGCHSPDRHRTGPKHCGLLGRMSGTASGYDYSAAMGEAGITWNAQTLDRFLAAPTAVVPGTTMGFAGIADDAERRDLIAYLATLTPEADTCRAAAKGGS